MNSIQSTEPSIQIIYNDDDLMVINKPAGLLSIPDGYTPGLPHVRSILEPSYGRLYTVHRLDRDTSGILLLARTRNAHRILNDQFEQRKVKKYYHVIVDGSPVWEKLRIDLPLRINGDRHHRTVISPIIGKPAQTVCTVLERWHFCSLLEAVPLTGYTHQIRTHLAASGFPVSGDLLYGSGFASDHPLNSVIFRLALHAHLISFAHPGTGTEMLFSAPYPHDFSAALSCLRNPHKH